MLRLSYLYYRNVLKGHIWRLVSIEMLVAVGVGLAFYDYTRRGCFASSTLLFESLVKVVATYATGGLAASLTVTTVLVRIIGADFAEQLSDKVDTIHGLVFHLSQSSMASWLMLLTSSFALFVIKPDVNVLAPATAELTRRIACILVGGLVYVVLGYLSVLQILAILAVQRLKQHVR